VAVDNVLYVTSKANAATLQGERQNLRGRGPSKPAPAVPSDKGVAAKSPRGASLSDRNPKSARWSSPPVRFRPLPEFLWRALDLLDSLFKL